MTVGQSERVTQNRVIALFRDELRYRYLGDWTDRSGNSNIEEGLLSTWLTGRGHSAAQIGAVIRVALRRAALLSAGRASRPVVLVVHLCARHENPT